MIIKGEFKAIRLMLIDRIIYYFIEKNDINVMLKNMMKNINNNLFLINYLIKN